MMRLLITLIACSMLAGCVMKPNEQEAIEKKPNKQEAIDKNPAISEPLNSLNIQNYFPDENRTFIYKGEGNEFAAYKEDFFQKSGEYLTSIMENGGTRILKVYQLKKEGIYLVYEQPEYYEEAPIAIESLQNKFNPIPLLIAPLEVGTKINDSVITKVDEELTLPIGKLTDIIVTEQNDTENHSVLRKYWAPKYGLVKTEFISTEDEESRVTSELESIQ